MIDGVLLAPFGVVAYILGVITGILLTVYLMKD